MAEVLADEHGFILWLPMVEEPTVPYWTSVMAVAKFSDKVVIDDDCEHNCIFTTEEGKILGVQMLDPVDNNGAPIESVMDWLGDFIPQEDIDDLIESVTDVKQQIGLVDDEQLKEFMNMMKDFGEPNANT